MTAQVSANGRGQNFVAATLTKNGDRAPARAGNQQITAKLPANTRCTGGTAGNRCLVVSPKFRFRAQQQHLPLLDEAVAVAPNNF
jgi:hypothetical protein